MFELCWFETQEGELVDKEKLPDLTIEKLKEIFFTTSTPAVVQATQKVKLDNFCKHKIDLNNFDYFVDHE